MPWVNIFRNPLITGVLTGAGTAAVAAMSDKQHFNPVDPSSWVNLGSVAMAGAIAGALAHRMPTDRQVTDKAVVEALVNAYEIQVMRGVGGLSAGDPNSDGGYIGIVSAFGISVVGKTVDEAKKNATTMLRATVTGRIIAGLPMPMPDKENVLPGAVSVTDPGTGGGSGSGAIVSTVEGNK